MKVLVACEESQRVCTAFRERGHEAYSCDIQEPSGGHPEWHVLGDVLKIIGGGAITTMDGVEHNIGKWDMMIAHPPCVYLTNVATRHFSLRMTPPEKVVERWEKRADAAIFFMQFALADIPKIAVENPVGFMNLHYKPPTQIIHPWMFAESENDTENYKTKRTCLWLKGLPPLKPNDIKPPNNAEMLGRRKGSNKVRNWCEDVVSQDRSKERSKTFEGIAKAFASQWGGNVE